MIRNSLIMVLSVVSLALASCSVYDDSLATESDSARSYLVLDDIEFAGRTWIVKSGYCSTGTTAGPGPNYWCGEEEDVWVDAQDRLHLRINYKESLSEYASVSVKTPVSGCGMYRYHVTSGPNGEPDDFDENVVLGLFSYETNSTYDNYEVDIEISDWGDSTPDYNLWYSTWDGGQSTSDHFLATFGSGTVEHAFTWQPSAITFTSIKNDVLLYDGVRIDDDVYPCPASPIYARINLWMYQGESPSSEQEIIIDDFEFIPFVLLNAPTGVTADATSSSVIQLEWTDTSAAETGIEIERKEYGGSYSLIDTLDPDEYEYEDTGLDSGTTYVYRIRAVGDYEDGPWSDEVQEATSGGGVQPSLSAVNFSFDGWYGYVEGTISNMPAGTYHARSWVQTNDMYREGKDLDVGSSGYFLAIEGLWGSPSPTTYIWVTLHLASTDVYGTGDGVSMDIEDWPDEASPDYVFGPFVTQ